MRETIPIQTNELGLLIYINATFFSKLNLRNITKKYNAMKTYQKIVSILTASLFITSCSSESDSNSNNNETTLNKRIIYQTQSLYPTSNTKQIQYYENNQVMADTTFNYLNEWMYRKIIVTQGNVKMHQTLDTNGQITEQWNYTYDSQNRLTSRKRVIPLNLLTVTYTYHSNNTVTANAINDQDMSTTYVGTYYIDNNGLIYKEVRPDNSNPSVLYENIMLFDNLKPTALTSAGATILTFNYYPNAKPSNLLKSNTELNNGVLNGLSLMSLAEQGNFYLKRDVINNNGIVTTHQTDFNSNNYIDYTKSTYINTNANNNLLTTEVFYYYN